MRQIAPLFGSEAVTTQAGEAATLPAARSADAPGAGLVRAVLGA